MGLCSVGHPLVLHHLLLTDPACLERLELRSCCVLGQQMTWQEPAGWWSALSAFWPSASQELHQPMSVALQHQAVLSC